MGDDEDKETEDDKDEEWEYNDNAKYQETSFFD